MAQAMHKRPRPLRSSDFGQPVITVIGIALQEASVKAMQELLRERAAATGGISEQHDRRTWAAVAAVVGDDRPEVAFLRLATPGIEHRRQMYFGRRVTSTRHCAGITSRRLLVFRRAILTP